MIIPCMNCTSAGELGGSLARVDRGSVRVGCPGAPGCTMTGVAGSACCAQTGKENNPARVPAASKLVCHVETFITDACPKRKDDVGVANFITKQNQDHFSRKGAKAQRKPF